MQLEIPIRRRGREPPKPTTSSTAGSSDDPREGWQLHHSSNGLPFYFNRTTGESVWARTSTGTAEEPRSADDGARAAFTPIALAPLRSAGGSSRAVVPSGGREVPSSSSPESDSTESSSSPTSWSTTSGDSTSHDKRRHFSPQSSSQSDKTSDDSWTGSMERKFRRLVRSEQGRVMLKSEVQALAERISRRGHKRTLTGVRKRGQRASSTAEKDTRIEDVEMALLPTDTGKLLKRMRVSLSARHRRTIDYDWHRERTS